MSDVFVPDPEVEAAFQRRFDMSRMVLERKFRWAKVTLRNLQPVARASGTLAVDKYLRMYYGPVSLTWTDQEFVGAVWHEVNHILRRHHDRLSHLPKRYPEMDPMWVNVAADLEINDDLKAQSVSLPDGVCYSEMYEHEEGPAERHFFDFLADQDEKEEGGGKGDNPQDTGLDCGSGAGGQGTDEMPAPDMDGQEKLNRSQEKQDQDTVDAAEKGDQNGLPPGMGKEVYEEAVKRLGRSEHDWKATLAVELRNAMEQRADEAEEYTFRRRSRRAGVSDEIILPGSFRPIPKLGVGVDVSGSMDKAKLEASMRELHGILERLAIPSFTAYAWNTRLVDEVRVQTAADIGRVMENHGGGTDMQACVNHAVENGDEVIIVLTDNETRWLDQGPWGVPVIIGGINRRESSPVPKWARLVDIAAEKGQFND